MLSTDPAAAKDIVLADKPAITTESEAMDRSVLDRLLLYTGTLASIYQQAPESFIRGAKPKHLHSSSALDPAARQSFLSTLNLPKHIPPEHIISTTPAQSTPPVLPPKSTNGAAISSAPAEVSEPEPYGHAEEYEQPLDSPGLGESTSNNAALSAADPYSALAGLSGFGGLSAQFQEDGDEPILSSQR